MTIKEYILKETNCSDFKQLKAKLLKGRKYEYGCYFSEIKCKGFSASYTNNDNCFYSFGISFRGVGMTNTLAIDKDSITQAGIKRGAGNHYLSDKQLNTELKK